MMPVAVSDVDIAFPAKVLHLMPKYEDIPEEFRNDTYGNKWLEFQQDWFFSGVDNLQFVPKEGIDPNIAWRHLCCIQKSFEPQHEHKQAAVAYLASLWFEDVTYEVSKK